MLRLTVIRKIRLGFLIMIALPLALGLTSWFMAGATAEILCQLCQMG